MITKDINSNPETYLSKQKSEFIKTLSETELHDFELFFRMIQKYETFYEKDVLFFSRSQIVAMFEDLDSTASTFEKRYRFLERYFEFCAKILPDISFSDLDVYQSLRRNSIRDFDEFLYVINHSFKPDNWQTLDVMRKSCVILLYMGISKSEITEVLKSDLDETAGTIVFRSSQITRSNIPLELLSTLKQCKEMESYNSANPKHINELRKSLRQNDYLIRCDASTDNNGKCPVFFINKIFDSDTFLAVDKELTTTRVIESGLYHWLYKKEKDGIEFNIKNFRELLKQYFNKPITKYQHYFQNYYSWRRAFDL